MECELKMDRASEPAVRKPLPPHLSMLAGRAQDAAGGDISQEPGLGVFAPSLGATSCGLVYTQTGQIPSASGSSELCGLPAGDKGAGWATPWNQLVIWNGPQRESPWPSSLRLPKILVSNAANKACSTSFTSQEIQVEISPIR